MDAKEMQQLFDSCWWFGDEISTEKQPSTSPATEPVHEIQSKTPKPAISRLPTLLVRCRSDDLSFQRSFKSDSPSPESVLLVPKLQPILSGKEVVEVAESSTKQENIEKPVKKKRDLRRRSNSKSLSDLEFEELKGFMDLGFVFSEEDKDSSLVSIIPGLQRLGKKSDEKETIIDESKIPRPYLSEAWDLLDRRMKKNPLMNWRIPASGNEIEIKDHLRNWAHTVASTVRGGEFLQICVLPRLTRSGTAAGSTFGSACRAVSSAIVTGVIRLTGIMK